MIRRSPRLNASSANRRSPGRYMNMNSGMRTQGFGNGYGFGGRSSMYSGYPGYQGYSGAQRQAQGRFNVRRR